MARPFEIKHQRRIAALVILVVMIFVFAAMRVFDFQVVQGSEFLAETQKNSQTTVSIVAARGEIVDRNGVPLTQNKAVFNIEFDYSFLKKGTENDTIYKLIQLFQKQKEEWVDTLPISLNAPYTFLPDRESDVARLKKALDVNEYATAQDCMEQIYRQCGIKKYENSKGKCTHCGEKIEVCEYTGFDERTSRLIGAVRAQMIQKQFSRYNTRYTFAEDVSTKMVTLIKEFSSDFVGVEVVEKAIRTYISGDVASHLIGSLGPIYAEEAKEYEQKGYSMNDIVGKSGIEKVMEDDLRGQNGTMQVVKDNKGNIIDVQEVKAPVAGKTIQLTLDYNFQKEVQQILADYIVEFNETNNKEKHVEAAAIVVLDAKTGGVLASVSYPYYDIAEYSTNYTELLNAEGNPLFNRALNGTYRPGSTFKPIVAAAGLTENLLTPSSTIQCTGKYQYWGTSPTDYQPTCLMDGHGFQPLNVSQALQHSCNIFFYDTGRQLGINRINQYANYFGLATDTGIEVKSAIGNLSSPEFSEKHNARWEQGNVVQAAIGQMDTAITPLQMAVEASTIANHGTRYNVHLVNKILSNNGKTVISEKEAVVASQFDMTEEQYQAIANGMIAAGQRIAAPNQLTDLGYSVAVKTGTPQVSTTKTNHAFIAFAPTDEPEIAISCMVEDGYGSNVLVRRILLAYERSKGIYRDGVDPSVEQEEDLASSSNSTSVTENQSEASENTASSGEPSSNTVSNPIGSENIDAINNREE